MKRGIVIFFTVFIAAQLMVVSSCRKKEVLETPFTRVLGSWKETKYATDDNNNGIIEPSEIRNIPTDVTDELTFNPDSTGVETSNSFPLNFRWHFIEGATFTLTFSANDTVTYNLYEVTSGDLTLTTNTSLGLVWYYYIKK